MMENSYTQIKHDLINGVYHNVTINSASPESRRAAFHKASQKIPGER